MGYLKDQNGNKSIGRLAFIIGFISAIVMTGFIVYQGEYLAAAAFFAAMAIPLASLKVGQKAIEMKSVDQPNKPPVP